MSNTDRYQSPLSERYASKEMHPKGIILTGGPNSCYEQGSPICDKSLFELGIPILGICYGAQLMMHILGGRVEKAPVRKYGKTDVIVDKMDSKVIILIQYCGFDKKIED